MSTELELISISTHPELRAEFLRAAEGIRTGEWSKNTPSAAYGELVLSSLGGAAWEGWLARREGRVVGRVAAFQMKHPALGLFEVDTASDQAPTIAAALIAQACGWLRDRGAEQVYGPMDASTWFQYRLREYAEQPPKLTYRWEPTTPPDYLQFFKVAGFTEVERYHTYGYELDEEILAAAAKRVEPATHYAHSKGFRFVPFLEGKTLDSMLDLMFELSLEGFKKNFLYEPIDRAVFKRLYGAAAQGMDLGLSHRVIAKDGSEAGFIFCFEDQGAVVVKSMAIRERFRGLHLSTALLHQSILKAIPRKPKSYVSALVKSGSRSEFLEQKHLGRKIDTWKHDYVLFEKKLAGEAPGPRGREVFEFISKRREGALGFYEELHRRYGDFIKLPLFVKSFFVLSDADAIKHVMLDHYRDYNKGPAFERLALILGRGLITSEGDLWKKQRRLVHPAFTRERLHGFARVLSQITRAWVDDWASRAEKAEAEGRVLQVDLASEMNELSLRLVSETLLGSDMRDEARRVGAAFTGILEYFDHLMITPARFLELIPDWTGAGSLKRLVRDLPTLRNRKFKAALTEIDSVVRKVIELRQKKPSGDSNLVSVLLDARDSETGEGMDPDQLRDEVMTILLAGHETIANALLWSWVLLSQNPEASEKLAQESRAKLAGRSPVFEDLSDLEYGQAVFEESMRLFPPVWRLTRQAMKADRILGFEVEKGASVVMVPYLIHRDPKLWGPTAHQFKPERFMDGTQESKSRPKSRFAYIPFGAGPRLCIGNHFAMMEAQIVLAEFSQRLKVQVVDADRVEPEPMITLRPKGKVLTEIRRRRTDAV